MHYIYSQTLIPDENRETHSLVIAYVQLLTITVDFDTWFTLVESSETCLSEHRQIVVWVLFGFVLLVVLIAELVILGWKLVHFCSGTSFYLMQPWKTRTYICDMVFGLSGIVVIPIAIALFLLADNRQPLDCFNEDSRMRRLIFLVISFVIFVIASVSFLVRGCTCVNHKGQLLAVNILDNNEFELYFEEDNCIVAVKCNRTVTVQRYSKVQARKVQNVQLQDWELLANGGKYMDNISCFKLAYQVDIDHMKSRLFARNAVAANYTLERGIFVICQNGDTVYIQEDDVSKCEQFPAQHECLESFTRGRDNPGIPIAWSVTNDQLHAFYRKGDDEDHIIQRDAEALNYWALNQNTPQTRLVICSADHNHIETRIEQT